MAIKIAFGPQIARNGRLKFIEHKGRNRHPKDREVPIVPELQASISATPSGPSQLSDDAIRKAVHRQRVRQLV
jgi:hypothetical protein